MPKDAERDPDRIYRTTKITLLGRLCFEVHMEVDVSSLVEFRYFDRLFWKGDILVVHFNSTTSVLAAARYRTRCRMTFIVYPSIFTLTFYGSANKRKRFIDKLECGVSVL
jgi:hypothetical protein